ncbi:MAG TPA: hypothetical protein VFO60_09640 [Candidatus Dormibacteraeota bacterium]|nr:hypothetical protein [Candidatus Dormibacteraeota bacterium]
MAPASDGSGGKGNGRGAGRGGGSRRRQSDAIPRTRTTAARGSQPTNGATPKAARYAGSRARQPTAASRQEAASARLAGSAKRTREEQRTTGRSRRAAAERRAVAEREAAAAARRAGAAPEAGLGIGPTGLLFRFVSCGTVAVGIGLLGHLTVVPERLGVGSALLGTIFLLSGFVLGGVLWYLLDARRRMVDPRSISDERIIFSFIVFTLMPFVVLVLVLVVWLIAFTIGRT